MKEIWIDNRMLQNLLNFTSKKNLAMNNILIDKKGKNVKWVATDGRALCVINKEYETDDTTGKYVIPAIELKGLKGKIVEIRIDEQNNRCTIQDAHVFRVVPLVECSYPNYENISVDTTDRPKEFFLFSSKHLAKLEKMFETDDINTYPYCKEGTKLCKWVASTVSGFGIEVYFIGNRMDKENGR